ncbi:MAG: pyridoxamine 5'-phosphate oxidase family protein [Actinobacteria bacterium]|nr:pyridoxamine 5'-phosphate oxidase family protein [Actinomycetota bacterium]MBU1493354.1 pyridoxamine 5'-phosphate oxidase family protein [Actinomycetota bacterium]
MTIDPAAAERLRTDLVGWLTTVARDGTPQASPVAFLWDGETVTVWSEPDAPKVTNLVENHRCSFHLNSDEYGLAVVAIEGTVHLPPDGPLCNEVAPYVGKYTAVFSSAWGLDLDEAAERMRQQIVITPRRIRSW